MLQSTAFWCVTTGPLAGGANGQGLAGREYYFLTSSQGELALVRRVWASDFDSSMASAAIFPPAAASATSSGPWAYSGGAASGTLSGESTTASLSDRKWLHFASASGHRDVNEGESFAFSHVASLPVDQNHSYAAYGYPVVSAGGNQSASTLAGSWSNYGSTWTAGHRSTEVATYSAASARPAASGQGCSTWNGATTGGVHTARDAADCAALAPAAVQGDMAIAPGPSPG